MAALPVALAARHAAVVLASLPARQRAWLRFSLILDIHQGIPTRSVVIMRAERRGASQLATMEGEVGVAGAAAEGELAGAAATF